MSLELVEKIASVILHISGLSVYSVTVCLPKQGNPFSECVRRSYISSVYK